MKRTMELIQQQLEVKDWPLTKPGDEEFFGYVVALGVFPRAWGEEDGMTQYADFAYNERYVRYRLPNDKDLKEQLHSFLWDNLNGVAHTGDIYGKVIIRLTETGHLVIWPP
jgi:hypothetical protein